MLRSPDRTVFAVPALSNASVLTLRRKWPGASSPREPWTQKKRAFSQHLDHMFGIWGSYCRLAGIPSCIFSRGTMSFHQWIAHCISSFRVARPRLSCSRPGYGLLYVMVFASFHNQASRLLVLGGWGGRFSWEPLESWIGLFGAGSPRSVMSDFIGPATVPFPYISPAGSLLSVSTRSETVTFEVRDLGSEGVVAFSGFSQPTHFRALVPTSISITLHILLYCRGSLLVPNAGSEMGSPWARPYFFHLFFCWGLKRCPQPPNKLRVHINPCALAFVAPT